MLGKSLDCSERAKRNRRDIRSIGRGCFSSSICHPRHHRRALCIASLIEENRGPRLRGEEFRTKPVGDR